MKKKDVELVFKGADEKSWQELLDDLRPHGEWVVVGRAAYGYVDIECPCCKYLRQDMQADNKPNFCENCGAYMGKDDEKG